MSCVQFRHEAQIKIIGCSMSYYIYILKQAYSHLLVGVNISTTECILYIQIYSKSDLVKYISYIQQISIFLEHWFLLIPRYLDNKSSDKPGRKKYDIFVVCNYTINILRKIILFNCCFLTLQILRFSSSYFLSLLSQEYGQYHQIIPVF